MEKLTNDKKARIDVLVTEIGTLNDLIETAPNEESKQKLEADRKLIIAQLNKLLPHQ